MAFAPIIPAILGLVSLASAGVGLAGALGAFAPDTPEFPGRDDPAVEAQRKQALVARQSQVGRSATVLTPVDEDAPASTRPTLLGGVVGQAATTL